MFYGGNGEMDRMDKMDLVDKEAFFLCFVHSGH